MISNQVFAGSDTSPMLRHFYPFGCPVYALSNALAAGKSIPKWHQRARLGVYLGRLPIHAQSVAFVLNLSTGNVSPQFHIFFDDLFETVLSKDQHTHPNQWKEATRFKRPKNGRDITPSTNEHAICLMPTSMGNNVELKMNQAPKQQAIEEQRREKRTARKPKTKTGPKHSQSNGPSSTSPTHGSS